MMTWDLLFMYNASLLFLTFVLHFLLGNIGLNYSLKIRAALFICCCINDDMLLSSVKIVYNAQKLPQKGLQHQSQIHEL